MKKSTKKTAKRKIRSAGKSPLLAAPYSAKQTKPFFSDDCKALTTSEPPPVESVLSDESKTMMKLYEENAKLDTFIRPARCYNYYPNASTKSMLLTRGFAESELSDLAGTAIMITITEAITYELDSKISEIDYLKHELASQKIALKLQQSELDKRFSFKKAFKAFTTFFSLGAR